MAMYSSASHEAFLLSDKLLNTQGEAGCGNLTMYHHYEVVVSLKLPCSSAATTLSPHLWTPIA